VTQERMKLGEDRVRRLGDAWNAEEFVKRNVIGTERGVYVGETQIVGGVKHGLEEWRTSAEEQERAVDQNEIQPNRRRTWDSPEVVGRWGV
jgi:hypothetical protein